MTSKNPDAEALARQYATYPQEALLKVKDSNKTVTLGLPKETAYYENRIALTPSAVRLITNNGYRVVVETGAGDAAKFTDTEYSDAGATIAYSAEEAFDCNIVMKIEPPSSEEIKMLKRGNTLVSAIQIGNMQSDYLKELSERRTTAVAIEMIEDKVGTMPIVRAMSEIAGSTVMLIAAEYLSSVHDGKGIILGGITGVPPTTVVILGAGTVAEYAASAALGLGAEVKIFDNHIHKLERLRRNVGKHIYTSTIEASSLANTLEHADVVIGALRAHKSISPCVVTDEMVAKMKTNSVIIDVSIDQGGCFETSKLTTHRNPVFRKYGVIHYCVPNIPSRVARTASTALSNILSQYLVRTAASGGIQEMIFDNPWFMKGVYMYGGKLTNEHIAKKFNMRYQDLKLIMAARV